MTFHSQSLVYRKLGKGISFFMEPTFLLRGNWYPKYSKEKESLFISLNM